MTREEYKSELDRLEQEFLANKRQLAIKCASDNNTVKVGDIVTDHIGSILVKNIKAGFPSLENLPCCVYDGIELKKDKTLKKIPTKRSAWQCNLVENADRN